MNAISDECIDVFFSPPLSLLDDEDFSLLDESDLLGESAFLMDGLDGVGEDEAALPPLSDASVRENSCDEGRNAHACRDARGSASSMVARSSRGHVAKLGSSVAT